MRLSFFISLLWLPLHAKSETVGSWKNTQVMERVSEHLADYLRYPVEATNRVVLFRSAGGFPNSLAPPDRDQALRFWHSEGQATTAYYGLEDGTFLGNSNDPTDPYVWYREPGESGYIVNSAADVVVLPPEMEKFWNLCVTDDGIPQPCLLKKGEHYVNCTNGCQLEPCEDDDTKEVMKRCFSSSQEVQMECLENDPQTKWCPQYTIETTEKDIATLGFLPTKYLCVGNKGTPEQRPGRVLKNSTTGELGSCTFLDGTTPLDNQQSSSFFANCGTNVSCNTTYIGAFADTTYDPRFRPWYVQAKQRQAAGWSNPYPFFEDFAVGITYSQPIYNTDNGESNEQKVFQGVVAFDYKLEEISQYLVDQYGSSSNIHVVIVEDTEPNHVLASSSGSQTTFWLLKGNSSQPCPYQGTQARHLCETVRVSISELDEHPNDSILKGAFFAQKEAGWPLEQLVGITDDHIAVSTNSSNAITSNMMVVDQAYVSQSALFSPQPDANLQWRLIVATPVDRIFYDAALPGESTFSVILAIGMLGVVLCFGIFVLFFAKRSKPEIKCADWRFTCAFLVGCSLLNLSTLTLLGTISDQVCVLRMWSFNLLFAGALSPLFVKVFRMYKILGASSSFRRKSITHPQAALMTLPIPLAEVVLLTLFTFVDPPRLGKELEVSDGFATLHILCKRETYAFFALQGTFHGLLVLTGCVLAYLTRNVNPMFGEAWQLTFAMYNIAFTGTIIVTIILVADSNQSGLKQVLQATGTLWGTAFSASAFVLPRLSKKRMGSSSRTPNGSMRSFVIQGSARRLEIAQAVNTPEPGTKDPELSSVSSAESFG